MIVIRILLLLVFLFVSAVNAVVLSATSGFDFDGAIKNVQSMLNIIYHRYELNTPRGFNMWYTLENLSTDIWDTFKYKFARKLIDKSNVDFLMVFGGSSVTAGHDNRFNESYPMIVDWRLKPLFASVGINLIVRNIAMGANPCLPYNFCLETMGGLDPDFLSWEQGYNCGHSNPVYELVGHVAASSKNKALAHFVSSGSFTPKCNASSSSPAYSDSEWLPSADLTEWLPTIVDVADARNHLHRYFSSKGGSAAQYTATWRWKGMGGYGFNSWANNDECHFTDEATGSEVKGCSGASAGDNCALKFFSAESQLYGSDNGKGARHHPTRAMHLLRGEIIVWHLALTLLDALFTVKEDLQSVNESDKDAGLRTLAQKYSSQLKELQPDGVAGRDPKYCTPLNCEDKVFCYTDYRPQYTNMTLKSLIVGTPQWDYEPQELGDWSLRYGFLDAKPYFFSKDRGNALELSFRVTITRVSSVWLYDDGGRSIHGCEVLLDPDVDPLTFPAYTPSSNRKVWPHHLQHAEGSLQLFNLPNGTHVITLVKPLDADVRLSHVITWH